MQRTETTVRFESARNYDVLTVLKSDGAVSVADFRNGRRDDHIGGQHCHPLSPKRWNHSAREHVDFHFSPRAKPHINFTPTRMASSVKSNLLVCRPG